jgi:hypothetical protein
MNKISLHDLYEIKKKKDNKICDAYNVILNGCNKKIKTIAEMGGQSLYYVIPPIIIGYPLYDYNKCLNYIITTLQKSGLFVSAILSKNMIYISWKIEDISKNSKNRLLLH